MIPTGGLDLEIRLIRLPSTHENGPLSATVPVPLQAGRDNPLWIRVTTEDGFQVWTSPVCLLQD